MDTATTIACWSCDCPATPADEYPSAGYWRCSSCDLLFAPQRSSAPEEAALYDADYFAQYPGGEDYEFDEAQRRHEAARRIAFVKNHSHGGRLLEIGAAAGHFLRVASDAGYVATGIEPAAELARRGASRLGVDLRPGLLESAELDTGAFDVVCAWHVLEHLPDPRSAMGRVAELVKPAGVLCLEVPNVASVASLRQGEAWFHLHPQHHVTQFAPRSLRVLLERSGFEVLHLETVSPLSYLRFARAVRPRSLVAIAKEAYRVRRSPWKPDPERHELLRAVARRPA